MTIELGSRALLIAWILAAVGCNSLDDPPDPDDSGSRLVIPVDERPVQQAAAPPPAISGGTLRVSRDGTFAVASDPDRDLISVIELPTLTLRHSISLDAGSEPGRSVEDGAGTIHVVLRRAGALISLDPNAGVITQRRALCNLPRGVAFDTARGLLHVACADGALVSIDPALAEPARTVRLEPDLRDVIVHGDELWVTRFKTAELLRIDAQGQLLERSRPAQLTGAFVQPRTPRDLSPFAGSATTVALEPEIAWRAVATAAGGVTMVHQAAITDEIALQEPSPNGSAYGGSSGSQGDCRGIVRNAVSSFGVQGGAPVTRMVAGSPLPVDIAVAADGTLAIAQAGAPERGLPRPTLVSRSNDEFSPPSGFFSSQNGNVRLIENLDATAGVNALGACLGGGAVAIEAPVTAVAFTPSGALLAQTREPAQLWLIPTPKLGEQGMSALTLSARSVLDSGHELFHRDAGGGIACASCHPEGGEDGHVWRFGGVGARRTQALHVGLADTAPFHWNGDLPGIPALMNEVFVGRMGGILQSPARLERLSSWLFAMPQPPALRAVSDPAAQRGRALFESTEVGCGGCHAGAKFTNNETRAVGTLAGGGALQVPSLIGVGYRAPFMHDGCAATLAGRFDPSCGGAAHGHTAQLQPGELQDLIAYLEAL